MDQDAAVILHKDILSLRSQVVGLTFRRFIYNPHRLDHSITPTTGQFKIL